MEFLCKYDQIIPETDSEYRDSCADVSEHSDSRPRPTNFSMNDMWASLKMSNIGQFFKDDSADDGLASANISTATLHEHSINRAML